MLTDSDFETWRVKCGLSEDATQIVNRIRKGQPERSVGSGYSVTGNFPSRKMGVTIQFESHKNELPAIYSYEHDKEVHEYYDQPSKLSLRYQTAAGRATAALHTPDFFLIKVDGAGWVECKTEEDLIVLALKQPNRFQRDENEGWRCPPGEAYASQFGLSYTVRSSAQINWTFDFNLQFLQDYFRNTVDVSQPSRRTIHQLVKRTPGINLYQVLNNFGSAVTADDVYAMIVDESIFVDLCRVPLNEPRDVMVFPNRVASEAYDNIHRYGRPADRTVIPSIDLIIGCKVLWDDVVWQIVNFGAAKISLLDNRGQLSEIPLSAFSELVGAGAIQYKKADEPTISYSVATEALQTANSDMLEKANWRKAILDAVNSGEDVEKIGVSKRSIKRWVNKAEKAKQSSGASYIGLIDKPRPGNRTPRLDPESEALISDVIENKYETITQLSRRAAFGIYLNQCEKRVVQPASYATFRRRANERDAYKQTRARKGTRAAYIHEEFHWDSKKDSPQHGSHPFHIVHIDHTEMDIQLNDSKTGKNFNRAWLTLMVSASTRRVLAFHVSYNSASKVACMEILRECVRRHKRLPQNIVVDGGKEFGSVYFEAFLAMFEVTKKVRPPAKSRFGTICERMFSTVNTEFLHNLTGNTQIMKNVRQVTKSVNPENCSVYTLALLTEYLAEYLYEIYDKKIHSTLGESPYEAFTREMAEFGNREGTLIPYSPEFEVMTMPEIPRVKALVKPGKGIRVNYLDYFCEEFRHPRVQNTKVAVRFDPWNAGHVLAYVEGRWRTCLSNYRHVFAGRTTKEIEVATKELHRRRGAAGRARNMTAQQLAHFIDSAEGSAALLSQQIKDRETKAAMRVLQGGLAVDQQATHPTMIPISVNGGNVHPHTGEATSAHDSRTEASNFDVQDNVVLFPEQVVEYETF